MIESKLERGNPDVYRDDFSSTSSLPEGNDAAVFSFVIHADAEPNAFARIANLFDIANLAPHRALLERDTNDTLTMSVNVGPLSSVRADMIARKLRQLSCVRDVQFEATGTAR